MSDKADEKGSSQPNSDDAVPGLPAGVISQSITEEMRHAYIDYAMSVIMSRALPDVRDGLKPVQRRILYTMNDLNLSAGAKTRKSAKIIGDVTGNYHPHGTAAAYGALVTLVQDFTMRYPLAIGQGNFGTMDGDSPAADRYTEAKMSRIAGEMLTDIKKDTVDMRPNYEGTRSEPVVLPAGLPNLLLNGSLGIAVGMATNIPPHNVGEVIDATTHMIDNPDASTEDLLEFVKGPDFPTGAVAFNKKDIINAYTTGRGGVVVRGEAEIIEGKRGNTQIVITSVPYRVNKADMHVKIAQLARDKKIEGIKEVRDESTKDVRLVIDLKGGAHPQKILNYVYKHTSLEDTFHYNLVALVDGVPKTLSLKTIVSEFVKHRIVVVQRRARFDLRQAQDREHILLGLKKALDHIDEVISTIRKSKSRDDAKANLIKKFKFSDKQAEAILQMQLQRLAALERQKVEDELKEIQKKIKELEALLKSDTKQRNLIKKELSELREKYADERRTRIMARPVGKFNIEDLIPDEEQVLVLTTDGYIKRTSPDSFKAQRRGGVGVIDIVTKDDDTVSHILPANLHNDILFFTDRGKVYRTKLYDLPEGKRATKGKSLMNYISLEQNEYVSSVLAMPKEIKNGDFTVTVVTKSGTVKRVDATSFHDVRANGLIAINLQKDDSVVSVFFTAPKDDVMCVTSHGQSIRFAAEDVRVMGRAAGGVRGMRVASGDHVVAASLVGSDLSAEATLTIVMANGYGKRTKLSEYQTQGRGGSGVKTAKVTDKTGPIIGAAVTTKDHDEMIAMSINGQSIRLSLDEVPVLGRMTQGVRIMKLRSGDKVSTILVQ